MLQRCHFEASRGIEIQTRHILGTRPAVLHMAPGVWQLAKQEASFFGKRVFLAIAGSVKPPDVSP
jgi:hypothetical protein